MTNLYTIKELAEAKGTSWVVREALLALEAENIKLRESLQYCVDAIASWEKKPEGVDPWLLGALDHARETLGDGHD